MRTRMIIGGVLVAATLASVPAFAAPAKPAAAGLSAPAAGTICVQIGVNGKRYTLGNC